MQYIYPENFKSLPVYFRSIGIDYDQENVFRSNGNKNDQILFVQEGEGTVTTEGKTYPLKKGSAFYLKSGIPHQYGSCSAMVTAWVTYRGSGLHDLCAFFGNLPFLYFEELEISGYLSDLRDMHHVYYTRREESTLSAMLYAMIIRFFNETHTRPITPMEKALLYIEQHFTEHITLEQLTEIACVSKSQLAKEFKKAYGCTAFEKISDLRLSFAEGLLKDNPKCKVKDAAHRSGFEDESYFCRVYKKKYGISPLQKVRGTDH